jgi:UDP-N-acetylglucosamine--N-acetylmuramyl-(pentapeptide) pyrophosphoryl-undecaprenol N-acetylglucosamine transferase
VEAAPELVRRRPDLEVVHQTGAHDLVAVREAYRSAGVAARAESFVDPVVGEMRAADLVICRAGATTLAELAALGRPALLVPFPAASDDHQRKNARVLAAGGAADVLDQQALSGATLVDAVEKLMGDRSRLAAMSVAMRGFARPDAAANIVDRVIELASGAA